MQFIVKHQHSLQAAGLILLIVGGVFAFYSIEAFTQIPNYLRLLTMLPLTSALPLIYAPTFADWRAANFADKCKAVGGLVCVTIMVIGAFCWYLFAPDVRT